MVVVQSEFYYGIGKTFIADLKVYESLGDVKPTGNIKGSTEIKTIVLKALAEKENEDDLISKLGWSRDYYGKIVVPTIKFSALTPGSGLVMSVAYWNGIDEVWMTARDLASYIKSL